mmetsp:Transcript_156084/g.276837  ORF Transcript_156084/g.276837 Transcript_156084/m.276837 type:complete len:217 (+) Transcript_156084:4367-5017(+)
MPLGWNSCRRKRTPARMAAEHSAATWGRWPLRAVSLVAAVGSLRSSFSSLNHPLAWKPQPLRLCLPLSPKLDGDHGPYPVGRGVKSYDHASFHLLGHDPCRDLDLDRVSCHLLCHDPCRALDRAFSHLLGHAPDLASFHPLAVALALALARASFHLLDLSSFRRLDHVSFHPHDHASFHPHDRASFPCGAAPYLLTVLAGRVTDLVRAQSQSGICA